MDSEHLSSRANTELCTPPASGADDDDVVVARQAEATLRDVIVKHQRRHQIARVIATWPCHTLSLARCVSEEQCVRILGSMEVLWTHLIKALALLSDDCRLHCIDFRGFTADDNLLFTVMLLLPLSVIGEERRQCADDVISLVEQKYEVPQLIRRRLSALLNTLVHHRVFNAKQHLRVPSHGLDIRLYDVHLASDKVSLLAYLVACSLQPLSRVRCTICSVLFTFPKDKTFEPFNLLPLQILHNSFNPKVEGLKLSHLHHQGITLTLKMLHQCPCFHNISSLSISSCDMNLSSNCQLRTAFLHTLKHLTHLTSLAISGAKIDGNLTSIVNSIGSGCLTDLSLQWCCVTAADLSQLGSSQSCANLMTIDLSLVHPPYDTHFSESSYSDAVNGTSQYDSGLCSDWSARSVNGHVAKSVDADDTDITLSSTTLTAEGADNNINFDVLSLPCNGHSVGLNATCTFANGELAHAPNDLAVMLVVFVQQLHRLQNLRTLRLTNRLSCKESTTLIVDILEEKLPVLQHLEWLDVCGLSLSVDSVERLVTAFAKQCNARQLSASLSHDVRLPTYVDKGQFWTRLHNAKQGRNLKVNIDNFAILDYAYDSHETLADNK